MFSAGIHSTRFSTSSGLCVYQELQRVLMLGRLATALFLTLPLAGSAVSPRGSVHRRHHENARSYTPSRRGPTYKLVDDYNKDTFLE